MTWKIRVLLLLIFDIVSVYYGQQKKVFFLNESHYKTEKLKVSSHTDETSPQVINDKLYFISNRPVEVGIKNFSEDNSLLYRIFYCALNGATEKPKQLFPFFLKETHEGPFCMNKKQDHVWYTTNASVSKSGKSMLTICEAVLTAKGWEKKNNIFFDSLKASSCHPFLFDNDSKIIFSADIKSLSLGGMDLYLAEFSNGKWGNLKNLGSNVNSAGNEAFPFVDESGNLFYCSNGKEQSKTDYDIYYVNLFELSQPSIKLPQPFNSNFNENGIFWNSVSKTGYFSSNRSGTDDIYSVNLLWPKTKTADTMSLDKYCYEFSEESSVGLDDTLQMAYEWDFGDGHKAKGLNASRCFEKEGSYKISLNIIDKTTGVLFFNQTNYLLDITDSFPIFSELKENRFSWRKKDKVDSVKNVFIEIDGQPFYSGRDTSLNLNNAQLETKEFYSVWRNNKLDTICRVRRKNFKGDYNLDTLLRIAQPPDINYRIHLGASDTLFTDIAKNLVIRDTVTYTTDEKNKIHYFVGDYADIDSTFKPLKKIIESGFEQSTLVAFTNNTMISGQTLPGKFEDYYKKKGFLKQYTVYYDFSKFTIEPAEATKIDSSIKKLGDFRKINFLITSFTDNTGSKRFNEKLSAKRSKQVKKLLLAIGVPLNRIKITNIDIGNHVSATKSEDVNLKRSDIYISYEK